MERLVTWLEHRFRKSLKFTTEKWNKFNEIAVQSTTEMNITTGAPHIVLNSA
jgi:hypothetical protein